MKIKLNRRLQQITFSGVCNFMRLTPLVLVCSLLTGCLPIPHTTDRTHEVRGRVIDARTHSPIQGAKIYLCQEPQHTTYTDATGRFRLKATRNFHLAYAIPEGNIPDRKDGCAQISHPDYQRYGFAAGGMVGESTDMGDILLKPRVRIAIGISSHEVVDIPKRFIVADITSKLDLKSSASSNSDIKLYEFREYDAIVKLSVENGKVIRMSYWTKKDFGDNNWWYRAKTEKNITALKLDLTAYDVSIEKAK